MQLGVLTLSLCDELDHIWTLQEFMALFIIQRQLKSILRVLLSLNQALMLPFTLMQLDKKIQKEKVLCGNLNTNVDKLIPDCGQ